MARAPRPRKAPRTPSREERPVLQLPLARPDWDERQERAREPEPARERGVAVIDFYI